MGGCSGPGKLISQPIGLHCQNPGNMGLANGFGLGWHGPLPVIISKITSSATRFGSYDHELSLNTNVENSYLGLKFLV